MNRYLDFLLSAVYDGATLHAEHLADLKKSGITPATIIRSKIRDVPPDMIEPLLGFKALKVRSAYLIPFPDPRGGWMDHVRLKVFGDDASEIRGDHVEEHRQRWRYNGGRKKYLVRRCATPRLFCPLATITAALSSADPLWICEGPKKGLALAQLELPTVAIESAWGWHLKDSRDLLPDFDSLALAGRIVKIVPDPDAQTMPQIARATHQFAEAVERRGARVQLVTPPREGAA